MLTRPPLTGATARNLELLRCIATGPAEFTLKGLAARARLPSSTVHRIIEHWVLQDFLEHDAPRSYRMGPELFRLAALVLQKFELRRLARPLLVALTRDWQETAVLCLFNPSTRSGTIADSVLSPHPLKFEMPAHSVISLVWGSLGRAILAHLPAQEIEAVLSRDPTGPLSHSPLPPRKSVLRELAVVRARRYALYESQSLNIAGISAPLLQADGRVLGSIGVIMPASRFGPTVRRKLPAAVMDSARRLGSQVMG